MFPLPVSGCHLSQKDKDRLAEMIRMDKDAFAAFEESYRRHAIEDDATNDGIFGHSAKRAAREIHNKSVHAKTDVESIVNRIVEELTTDKKFLEAPGSRISRDELMKLPVAIRPQCTSDLMSVDINEPSSHMVLDMLRLTLEEKEPMARKLRYGIFRAMLDTLDLDEITYEMLGKNPNSIGNWFPTLEKAIVQQEFFKVPATKIIKVPMPILQMSRLDYNSLTPTTLRIVDEFCMRAFELDVNKTYFIKTGTFSCKYDFRNAKVSGEKEVRELGEYLLYITNLSVQMASPLMTPPMYGAATTNEWVVREFIEDKEDNPCIYKGMPLHTEYRVFVDFDAQEVIGVSPYWRSDVMKKRFAGCADSDTADMTHDYIIYQMHEAVLNERYEANKDTVVSELQSLISNMDLHGQWSMDIMQNGNDFYVIDMALAVDSALRDVVPAEKLQRSSNTELLYLPNFSQSES